MDMKSLTIIDKTTDKKVMGKGYGGGGAFEKSWVCFLLGEGVTHMYHLRFFGKKQNISFLLQTIVFQETPLIPIVYNFSSFLQISVFYYNFIYPIGGHLPLSFKVFC